VTAKPTPVPRGLYAGITKLALAAGWQATRDRHTWTREQPERAGRGTWSLIAGVTRADETLGLSMFVFTRRLDALHGTPRLSSLDDQFVLLGEDYPLAGLTAPVVARALIATYRERIRAWEDHWDWEEREGWATLLAWAPVNGWRTRDEPKVYSWGVTPLRRGEVLLVPPHEGDDRLSVPTLRLGQARRVRGEGIHAALTIESSSIETQVILCPPEHLDAGLALVARWLDAYLIWRPWDETLVVADDGTPPL